MASGVRIFYNGRYVPASQWDFEKGGLKPAAPGKGVTRPTALGPPPVGTYDPAIDYQAGAANRGYQNLLDDANTSYEQGQQDYDLGLGDLTTTKTRTLADLLTGENRLNQDYGIRTADLGRSYSILGHQQAQNAARQGVTSAGLLGKSNAIRAGNQQHDQAAIDLARTRGLEDIGTQRTRTNENFDRGKLGLDLGFSRQFGSFNGNTRVNPITGKPEIGSLVTNLTRAGTENTAFQTASAQQRTAGAQAGGYVDPSVLAPTPAQRRAKIKAFQKARGT